MVYGNLKGEKAQQVRENLRGKIRKCLSSIKEVSDTELEKKKNVFHKEEEEQTNIIWHDTSFLSCVTYIILI